MYGIFLSCILFSSSLLFSAGVARSATVAPAKRTGASLAIILTDQVAKGITLIRDSQASPSSSLSTKSFLAPDDSGVTLSLESADSYSTITATCSGRKAESDIFKDSLRTTIFTALLKTIWAEPKTALRGTYDSKTKDEEVYIDPKVKVTQYVCSKDNPIWSATLLLRCYSKEIDNALAQYCDKKEGVEVSHSVLTPHAEPSVTPTAPSAPEDA